MPIPYLITTLSLHLRRALAAADASLVSMNLISAFPALRWVRVHFITLGILSQVIFGLLPMLDRLPFQKTKSRLALGHLADPQCGSRCPRRGLRRRKPAHDPHGRYADLHRRNAPAHPTLERDAAAMHLPVSSSTSRAFSICWWELSSVRVCGSTGAKRSTSKSRSKRISTPTRGVLCRLFLQVCLSTSFR